MEPPAHSHVGGDRADSASKHVPEYAPASADDSFPQSITAPSEDSSSRQEPAHRAGGQVASVGPFSWAADAAGHIVAGLESWCAFTGQAPEDAAAEGWLAAVHPDERAEVERAWAQAVAAGTPYTHEHRVRCAGGHYHVIRDWATPIRAPDGRVQTWVGVSTDLSERMEFERALADARAREQAARAAAESATARMRASRREAAAATRELGELQALTDIALTHLGLDELLRELLSRLQAIMQVDNAAILLLDESERMLTVHAARGPEEAVVAQVHVPLGQGFAGRIAASRVPLLVEDLSQLEVVNPLLRETLRSVVGVPLLIEGRVLGVVHVGTARRRRFTSHDVELLQKAADRVAMAVDRARLFAAMQRALDQAAEQARELDELLEAMPDAVMVFDRRGGVQRMNSAAHELLGLAANPEFYARPLADRGYRAVVCDEAGQPLPEEQWPFERVLRGEVLMGSDSVDIRYQMPGHPDLQVSVIGAPLRDTQGQITGAVCVIRDVTERRRLDRRTHEALGAMLAMAQALVAPAGGPDAAAEASGDAAADGTSAVTQRLAALTREVLGCERVAILAVDPQTERIRPLTVTGLAPEQGHIWQEEWHATIRLPEIPLLAPAARLAPGDVLVLDLTRPPYNEQPNPYGIRNLLIAPMHLGRQLVGLLAVDHGGDAHGYTAHEQALAGGVARLAALVVERERLLREREAAQSQALALEEANRKMNQFLSIASHELKTPVTVIKTNLGMIERAYRRQRQLHERVGTGSPATSALDAERIHLQAERALRGMDRLARLVDDLLDVSRIQAGHLELRRVPCDLREVVREVVAEQREVHPQRTIQLSVTAPSAVWVHADIDRLRQVVINYLTNALKYSPKDRPVTVQVSAQDGTARVAVVDEGPGIAAHEQAQLWELFHRVPGIEVQVGSTIGLGLGLHICKTIVERHGGQVGVESTVGKGSTFWFTLPLDDAAEPPTPPADA